MFHKILYTILFISATISTWAQNDTLMQVNSFDGPVNDALISGTNIYIARGDNMDIYSTDGDSITLISHAEPAGHIHMMAKKGGHMIWGDPYQTAGFEICNVQDSTNPAPGTTNAVETQMINSLFSSGDYLYYATGTDGATIYDISNISSFTLVNTIDSVYAHDLFVDGNYLYLLDYNESSNDSTILMIYNVSNPSAPVFQDSVYLNMTIVEYESRDMYVTNGYAYIIGQGMRIIDVSNPADPVIAGGYDLNSTEDYRDVFVDGNVAFITEDDSLHVLDVSNPAAINVTSLFPLQAGTTEMKKAGDRLCLVSNTDIPICLLNISNLADIQVIDSVISPTAPTNTYVVGNKLYYTTPGRIFRYDISSNPSMPQYEGSYEVPWSPNIKVGDKGENCLIVLDFDNTIHILDFTNPSNVSETGNYVSPHQLVEFKVNGNYIYAFDFGVGYMEIINISNLSNPNQESQISLNSSLGKDIVFSPSGNLAYVASWGNFINDNELKIFNITNPASPQETGAVTITGEPLAVTVKDTIVFMSAYNILDLNQWYIYAVNVADSTNPSIITSINDFHGSEMRTIGDIDIVRDSLLMTCLPFQGVYIYNFNGSSIEGPLYTAVSSQPVLNALYIDQGSKEKEDYDIYNYVLNGDEIYSYRLRNALYKTRVLKFCPNEIKPILTLGGTSTEKDYCCSDFFERSFVSVFEGTIHVDIVDDWFVQSITFSALGNGNDTMMIDTVILVCQEDTSYGVFSADNGNVSLAIGKIVHKGETLPFTVFSRFRSDWFLCQNISDLKSFAVSTNVTKLIAEPVSPDYADNYEMIPETDFTSADINIGKVYNEETLFGNLQNAIDHTSTLNLDTLKLCPCRHINNVSVNKPVIVTSLDTSKIQDTKITICELNIDTNGVYLHHLSFSSTSEIKINNSVTNTKIENNYFFGDRTDGDFIFCEGGSNVTICNNIFKKGHKPIRLRESSNIEVNSNIFNQAYMPLQAERCTSVTFVTNDVVKCSRVAEIIESSDCNFHQNDIITEKNSIKINKSDHIYIHDNKRLQSNSNAVIISAKDSRKIDIYSNSNLKSNNGTYFNILRSDSVCIYNNIIKEGKGCVLDALNCKKLIVRNNSFTVNPYGDKRKALNIQECNNSEIKENYFDFPYKILSRITGLDLFGNDNVIYSNTFKGHHVDPASYIGADGIKISGYNNSISYNLFTKNVYTIVIEDEMKNNTIYRNNIKNSRKGIQFQYARNNDILYNDIYNNIENGISVTDSSKNITIRSNRIKNNGGAGVYMDKSTNIVIENNEISGNQSGIKGKNYEARIEGNKIYSNYSSTGIHMDHSTGYISGNALYEDANDGIMTENESDPVINYNNIYNNDGNGVLNSDPNITVDARYNWWGDASGPSGEGSGDGDEVSVYVDFSPHLDQQVGVVLACDNDTVPLPAGISDSTGFIVQNWRNLSDIIDITITDERNWITGAASYPMQLIDTMPNDSMVYFTVPDTVPGTYNKVTITGTSQADNTNADTVSFVIGVYQQELDNIIISPDSVVIAQDDSIAFEVSCYDQHGYSMTYSPTWTANGGTFNDGTEYYTAGSTTGIFNLIAGDGGVYDTARIYILDKDPYLNSIEALPSYNIVAVNDTAYYYGEGLDQFGDHFEITSYWSCTGGTIDTNGIFIAGSDTGSYYVVLQDSATGTRDTAIVNIVTGDLTLLLPDDNTMCLDTISADVSWEPFPDAGDYIIQLSKYDSFDPLISSDTLPPFNNIWTFSDLEQVTQYYWRVKVTDIYDSLFVSGSFSFTTKSIVDLGTDSAYTTESSYTIDAGSDFISYSWSTGATTQTVEVSETGDYYITVTDINGCTSSDSIFVDVDYVVNIITDISDMINIYPNPNSGKFVISIEGDEQEQIAVNLYNHTGQKIYHTLINRSGNSINIPMDISRLSQGIYILEICTEKGTYREKIIIY